MITPPPGSSTHATTNPLSHFIQATLSYDSNIMLAAIISLLLVILFVLLLNIYARWFLVQARQRSRSSVTVPNVLGSRFHRFTIIDTTSDSSPSKGLHPSLISSLPLFVYYNPNDEANKQQHGLECAICISSFEEEEVGRKLPKCGHAFHVECIDMWLHSHSTCPICRAAVVCEAKMNVEIDDSMPEMLEELLNFTGGAEIDVVEDLSMETEYNVRVGNGNDLVSGFSSLESSLGGSLKRILSSNRTERRVHPSAGNVSELEV